MRNKIFMFITIILLIFGSVIFGKTRIAIMDFGSQGLSPMDAAAITNFLRTDIVKTNKFIVLDRANMDKLLEEQNFQHTGCTDQECAVKIGKLLNVEKMIIGNINKLGTKYFINVNIVNVESSIIESAYDDECNRLEDMRNSTRRLAKMISGGKVPVRKTTLAGSATGNLFVKSDPSSGDIYVDGILQNKKTPASIEGLSVGKHSIRVVKDNFDGIQEIEIIKDDFIKVTVNLLKMKCKLMIKSKPYEADVLIDGVSKGKTPVNITNVSAGIHKIELSKSGYFNHIEKIDVQPAIMNMYDIQLDPAGYISIRTVPDNTDVYLNEKYYEKSPIDRIMLKPGKYKLKIAENDYQSIEKDVIVTQGQLTEIQEELKYRYGKLNISTNPSEAECTINGTYRGQTPLYLDKIEPGEYRIKISKKDYDRFEKDVNIVMDETKNISAILEYKYGKLSIVSHPFGAKVLLNDKESGETPYSNNFIEPGLHNIKLIKEDYLPYTKQIQFEKGQIEELNISLVTDPVVARKNGFRLVSILSFIGAGICGYLTKNSNDKYNESLTTYNNAKNKNTVDTSRDELLGHRSKYKLFGIATGVLGAVGGVTFVISW